MSGFCPRPALAVGVLLWIGLTVAFAPLPARALAVTEPSPGCGLAAPAVPPSALVVDGRSRGFITAVPDSYRPDRPHALVLAFHGRTSPNHEARLYYKLEDHGPADTIYVYPSGLQDGSGNFTWWGRGDPPDALRDFALFDALVALFDRTYCVDRARIYAVGHSLGASFVNSLGCARGDVLRGIGTLAGGIQRTRCRGEVAAAIFHNPADRLVDFEYGLSVRNFYAAQSGDPDGPDLARLQPFNCAHYGARQGQNPIFWCPHHQDLRRGRYYPHQWPEEAGAAIMRFFAALPADPPAASRFPNVVLANYPSPPVPAARPRFVPPSPVRPPVVAHLPAPKPRGAPEGVLRP